MTTALFVHHSVGRQIIHQGGLRKKLQDANSSVEVWDHDYNDLGLSDSTGALVGSSFPIPGDNTDPDGLLAILRGIGSGEPWAERANSCDILILKSCFPNNKIRSDAAASALKGIYRQMREVAVALPQAVLLVSSPPLVFEATRPDQAARASDLATWLGSHWTGPRLGYADIFETLTYRSGPARGTLRLRYRLKRPRDSHLGVAGAEVAARTVAHGLRALL